jgi:hypothetical protein
VRYAVLAAWVACCDMVGDLVFEQRCRVGGVVRGCTRSRRRARQWAVRLRGRFTRQLLRWVEFAGSVGVDVVDWRSRGSRTAVQKFGVLAPKPARRSGVALISGSFQAPRHGTLRAPWPEDGTEPVSRLRLLDFLRVLRRINGKIMQCTIPVTLRLWKIQPKLLPMYTSSCTTTSETPCHALVAMPVPLPYSVQARSSVSLCYLECP